MFWFGKGYVVGRRFSTNNFSVALWVGVRVVIFFRDCSFRFIRLNRFNWFKIRICHASVLPLTILLHTVGSVRGPHTANLLKAFCWTEKGPTSTLFLLVASPRCKLPWRSDQNSWTPSCPQSKYSWFDFVVFGADFFLLEISFCWNCFRRSITHKFPVCPL